MDHLPPELVRLIVDHLHNDKTALKACSLVSRTFLLPAQAHIFENIKLRFQRGIAKHRNIDSMQALISSGPHGVLSHTRKLSIPYPTIISLSRLDEIFDHLMGFRNIRELRLYLDTSHFVNRDLALASHYFFHFQQVLRSLHLITFAGNPKDLVVFLTFFPFLEEVSLSFCDPGPEPVLGSWMKELDSNLLPPLRGTLRVRNVPPDGGFIMELAKVRVLYHTLELGVRSRLPGTGMSELVAACAPTLRILKISPYLTYDMGLDPRLTLTACTQLTEVRLPAFVGRSRDSIRLHAALLSTISSPHFHKIELAFSQITPSQDVAGVLSSEHWSVLEGLLLDLTRRSGNALQLVVLHPGYVRLPPCCNEFMPRFREVGEVRFDLL